MKFPVQFFSRSKIRPVPRELSVALFYHRFTLRLMAAEVSTEKHLSTWMVCTEWVRTVFNSWKSLENGDGVWKSGEKSWVFLFAKLQHVLYK